MEIRTINRTLTSVTGVREVRDDIEKNQDDYTKEAIVRARKHLLQAELPSIRIADCRRKLLAAKKELRQGKK